MMVQSDNQSAVIILQRGEGWKMAHIRWAAWALTGLLVLTGCSHHHHNKMAGGTHDAYWDKGRQDVEKLIDRTVKDPAKASQVKAAADEIVAQLKTGREQERAFHRRLYQLNSSYQAVPEEFMKILDEANNQRMRSASKVLGLRFKMRDLMTPEEWKSLSDQMAEYSGRYAHGGAAPTGHY
ncbi:hypothetical protein W02_27970 [Nitrospira sp. KM1]|uniref:hypothetical protein n=1 Tax=Nitrospira sp. KM1 TaxID=1936990 RepID=UPI0013A746EB|nr:hypothetical protein [Nitrospira sp. KM1]BCA55657.1 hypothetical protein W02_27970 [Nitrospira sp. KM1]